MRALKIDPWLRSITCVDLNLKPARSDRGKDISQEDKALRVALGQVPHYEVEPLDGIEDHRLILHPTQSHLMAGPTFHLQRDPARRYGGAAFILAADGSGFHAECRLAVLEVRGLIGFLK